jgi:hypothetical protein
MTSTQATQSPESDAKFVAVRVPAVSFDLLDGGFRAGRKAQRINQLVLLSIVLLVAIVALIGAWEQHRAGSLKTQAAQNTQLAATIGSQLSNGGATPQALAAYLNQVTSQVTAALQTEPNLPAVLQSILGNTPPGITVTSVQVGDLSSTSSASSQPGSAASGAAGGTPGAGGGAGQLDIQVTASSESAASSWLTVINQLQTENLITKATPTLNTTDGGTLAIATTAYLTSHAITPRLRSEQALLTPMQLR